MGNAAECHQTPPANSRATGRHVSQVKMKLTQFAAVIAGTNRQNAWPCGGGHCDFHGPGDRGLIDAVDHDFVGALNPRNQFRFPPATERGTKCLVCRGAKRLIPRPYLTAAADDPTGEGRI